MEDYKMKNAKQKPYEDGRSTTEMEPTLVELVGNLERQANLINHMLTVINTAIYYSEDEPQADLALVLDTHMPVMERLKRVIQLNYDTGMTMERLIDKINGGKQNEIQ